MKENKMEKMEEKNVQNTSQANENDQKKVGKIAKKVISAVMLVFWKPMVIIAIVFAIISLLTSFLKVIIKVEEEDVNNMVHASITLKYTKNLRNY